MNNRKERDLYAGPELLAAGRTLTQGGVQMVMKWLLSLIMSLASSAGVMAENLVVIKTSLGEITVALDEEKAPITVANFLLYIDDDSYDNTIFHRVIANFMIQGGGHYSDMSEAPEKGLIRNEADNGLKNKKGTIAMARLNTIDSAGRQFFINTKNNRFLDHSRQSCTREEEVKNAELRAQGRYKPQTCASFGYAVFGQVIDGMDVVDRIELSNTHSIGPYSDVPEMPVFIISVERVMR